jgi:hypothetical protein
MSARMHRSILCVLWLAVASCGNGSPSRAPANNTGGAGGDQGGTGGVVGGTGGSGVGGTDSGGSGGMGGSGTGGVVGGTGGSGTGGDQGGSGGSGGDQGGTGGSSADAGVTADATPPSNHDAGASTGGEAVLVWGHGEHGATTGPPNAMDMDFTTLLMAKGLKVTMVRDTMSAASDATGKALLVISSSVDRAQVMGKYKDVTVPAIVIKDGCFMPMGMGTDGVSGVGLNKITILAAADPLAAGLSGDVVVYTTTDRIIYSTPAATAKKIASMVGAPTQLTIFAYDAGAAMVGGVKAPAKRLGFFIHRDTDLNANGKKLFSAAIDWSLQ